MSEDWGNKFFEELEKGKDAQRPPLSALLTAALDLYKPPFKYHCGYIHDGDHRMFADNGDIDELKGMIAARVRGWGRIQYLKDHDPGDLQDAVGEHVAMALTEYWEKHQGS